MKRNEPIAASNLIASTINAKKSDGDVSVRAESLTRQIAMNQNDVNAYLLLGDLYHHSRNPEAAVILYRQALAINPVWGEIYHNLGNVLQTLRRFPEALQAYREAGRLMPTFAESHVTSATVLQSMGLPREALAECEQALARDPHLAEAHWNRALALLQLGEYAEGWREFEWRWQKRGYTTAYRDFPQPRWQGEPLQGRTILLHAEQAFGDVIMFSRFLPMVAAQGGRVVCECPTPLVRLIAGIPGVSVAVPSGGALPMFDCHLPLLSLPNILGVNLENLPEFPPVTACNNQDISVWQRRMPPGTALRVGLAWSGRSFPDPSRSCPYPFLASLGCMPGVSFISLQIGSGAEDVPELARLVPLVDLTHEITDFADTATLIRNLDLVITIDSAVAHLAGTVGCPTWLMLPCAADWRWLLDREDSPWYPGMRLFRQARADDWSELISRVRAALVIEVAKGTATFEGLYERGLAAIQHGYLTESRLLLERAHALNAHVPELYNARGVLATKEGDPRRAEELLRQAIALDAGYTDPLINLGNLSYEAEKYQESASLLLRAIEAAPEMPRGWQNLGVVFQGIGRITDAFSCFKQALKLDPDYATARWNLSNLELLTGDYANGWQNFEARFSKASPIALRHQDIPRWDGCPLLGKSLLVYAEQGYGDTLQFVRYLPLLNRYQGRIIFEAPDRSLCTLLESIRGIDMIFVHGESAPSADFQIPLLSLPGLLGTRLDSVPQTVPYLRACPHKVAAWDSRTADDTGSMRVGLCWFGRLQPDPRRSVRLDQMVALTPIPNVVFHSLQVGLGSEQTSVPPVGMRLRDDSVLFVDFSETAALISTLDLVISIDTAVAHLAGALGKPVWLLLPFAPDWRWLLERDDSPWYPGMRLFRQTRPGDWGSVMERIATELGTSAATYHDRLLRGCG